MSSSSGSDGSVLKALRAAASALSLEPFEATLNFIEEASGNAGFLASPCMEGNGDAVGNTLLELCQIRNDGVKRKIAKMRAKLLQVALLVRPGSFEARDEVAEKMQVWVV